MKEVIKAKNNTAFIHYKQLSAPEAAYPDYQGLNPGSAIC